MSKIKIKKDSEGNIKLVTFTNKMAAEKSVKNEPNERVDDFAVLSEFLVTDKIVDKEL